MLEGSVYSWLAKGNDYQENLVRAGKGYTRKDVYTNQLSYSVVNDCVDASIGSCTYHSAGTYTRPRIKRSTKRNVKTNTKKREENLESTRSLLH